MDNIITTVCVSVCVCPSVCVCVLLGQYSSEREPESSSETEARADQHAVRKDPSMLHEVGKTDSISKSLMRDELLIHAEKFTSQVPSVSAA